MENRNKAQSRRKFIHDGMRVSLLLSLGTVSAAALRRVTADEYVWQIDPFKCTQCGRCATECVMSVITSYSIHYTKLYETSFTGWSGNYFGLSGMEQKGVNNLFCFISVFKLWNI